MDEIRAHLDETYFAWIGESAPETVFFYRVDSPVILIEFDHQTPVAMRDLGSAPTRHHVHSVVRTPNGNDYGKDLVASYVPARRATSLDPVVALRQRQPIPRSFRCGAAIPVPRELYKTDRPNVDFRFTFEMVTQNGFSSSSQLSGPMVTGTCVGQLPGYLGSLMNKLVLT